MSIKQDEDEAIQWAQRHLALVLGAGVVLAVLLFLRLKKPTPTAEPAAPPQTQGSTVYNDTYNILPAPTGTPTPSGTPGGTPGGPVPAQQPPPPGPHPQPGPLPPAQRPPTPMPTPRPSPHQSVTVKPWPDQDSTLSGIAAHYHVSGGWMPIYNLDKSTIDNQAHQHGHYGDEYNWLYAGEALALP